MRFKWSKFSAQVDPHDVHLRYCLLCFPCCPTTELVPVPTSDVLLNYFNSWFSIRWWDGHVGVQNNNCKMSLKFCIMIESKSQDFFRYCSIQQRGHRDVTWKPRIPTYLHSLKCQKIYSYRLGNCSLAWPLYLVYQSKPNLCIILVLRRK